MARLNLTIPDALYRRLERFRDRVNVSKVCAVALEKELAMLEAGPSSSADAKVQRLLNRLQSHRDRWYQRGYQDGEEWAVETASHEELHLIGEEWEDDGEYDIEGEYPGSFDPRQRIEKWVTQDVESAGEGELGRGRGRSEAWERARQTVDEWAYLNGWHYAVRDLWQAVAPRLRRHREE